MRRRSRKVLSCDVTEMMTGTWGIWIEMGGGGGESGVEWGEERPLTPKIDRVTRAFLKFDM